MGFRNAVMASTWASTPARTWGITSRLSSLTAEKLMCIPLPALSARGLGPKSAYSPFRAATVSTAAREVTALSAAVTGSA